MSELKRCPFCGGEVDLFSWSQIPLNYQYGIECIECHTLFQINLYDTTMQETIEVWNTRKPIEKVLERLEEEVIDCLNSIDINADYYSGRADGTKMAFGIIKEEVI